MTKIQRAIVAATAAGGLLWASAASAQLNPAPLNTTAGAANTAFPKQNPQGPGGTNYQVNYPYPGQCVANASPANTYFPGLLSCGNTGSFACDASGAAQRSAGGWAVCGGKPPVFTDLSPVVPSPTEKFVWEVLNPPDYTPDNAANCNGTNCPLNGTYPGADYYEIGLHEAWGFQAVASAGLFPNPLDPKIGGKVAVPDGMQWTGLRCRPAVAGTGCPCPADANATYCPSGRVKDGDPLFTPIWGVGQINMGGGPLTNVLQNVLGLFKPATTGSSWSRNNYVATWPSIGIRGNTGTPVVVKWTNEFPNNHVLCPHPEAADWPCAIDRTFMGVKARIDPALAYDPAGTHVLNGRNYLIPPDGVNAFGSPQQPDNSWVTHLHGGEIPPSTDGFAEKWFGNTVTAKFYAGVGHNFVQPPFENDRNIQLQRPAGVNADTYTYPMVQEEATIWFHDHTLGKTHHNVIAGPAGFFPVKEPAKHGAVNAWTPPSAAGPTGLTRNFNEYTWLDPVTELRNELGIPMYDLFLAVQDRAFNEDGSINFSNGLGQTPVVVGTAACAAALAIDPLFVCAAPGATSVTAGVNPLVHPVWVPEYFGDHVLVNGVLWPKKTVEPGWYRIRIVDGSDSRCYTAGLSVVPPVIVNGVLVPGAAPAPGTVVANNLPFWIIANDQGYLKNPVRTSSFTMCPGERYELLVNFGVLGNNVLPNGAGDVYLTNSAVAPFPVGVAPTVPGAFQDMNVIMKLAVKGAAPAGTFSIDPRVAVGPAGAGVKSCAVGKAATAPGALKLTWNPTSMAANWAPNTVPTLAAPYAFNMPYTVICMPPNPALMTDPNFVDLHGPIAASPNGQPPIVRQVYLNERVDGVTLFPLGMQLNGVPFEYKVTETPKLNDREYWMFINLTVDAHPMHPHLVRHQIVSRQNFSVTRYKATLCGANTCQPGPSPGNEMVVVPDVTSPNAAGLAYLTGNPTMMTANNVEGGFKDATRVMPNQVTTIVADWTPRWATATANNPTGTTSAAPTGLGCTAGACAAPYVYESATAGPYVWHCHINSHEDSEMMRTSLVVP